MACGEAASGVARAKRYDALPVYYPDLPKISAFRNSVHCADCPFLASYVAS